MGIRIEEESGVATLTLDAAPFNHFSIALANELRRVCISFRRRHDLHVVVVRSDVPGFFVPHVNLRDVEELFVPPRPIAQLGFATLTLLSAFGPPGGWLVDRMLSTLSPFHGALRELDELPQVTIAVIEGRVGGIGSELALCADMRFGNEATVLNQLEAAFGGYPGAGGTQRLPLLVGEGRAMEIVTASTDIDAATAERWGYLNRVVPAAELRDHVARLAARIASFPSTGPRAGKALVRRAMRPSRRALQLEAIGFMKLLISPAGRARVRRFLDAGGQDDAGARALETSISPDVLG